MSGRGRELADVLKRRRINAACLQETKWKGARAREIGEGYKLFYCGSDGKRNGVGIVLDSRLKECVVDVKRVNDRLIAIKLIVDGVTLNLISVYAPQSGCEESVKEKFWEDFDCLLMDLQDSEEVYVGGDFNGHVGKESDGYERVHGGLGFGNRNADGEALLQAACAFDLAITNTWFKKKEEHLITYKSGHHATQIDYFLVRRRSLCCVKNCKVLPGEALVTQHRLILMDFKLSVSPKNSRTRPLPKTRWRMLENDECAIRFRNQILEKMIEMSDMKETLANECWIEMARYIRKVAKDVFGESKGKGLIDRDTWWWNDEVQNVLKEKKVAFKEWQVVKNVNANDIPVEVWKILKSEGCMWLTLFFNKLLHEETIPQEWCSSSLVPIFKNKGDVQDCNNYRGIKLISHTMKVWEKVIERRLREESEITENQFGFMPGRGAMDAIFALRQLCEKYRRAHKNLHMVFIDLEKAYDRVPREVLWWALKEKDMICKLQ
ncbi:craniofacial development protein 2-like [Vanessa cardui]|uniref:craniofacial development protein 2-like n=1 Tax=Vanessa cardui TaxID=171605 RepID=UPI001F13376C|nr:craniofacial development protein 2-like [Vanessa cardui]